MSDAHDTHHVARRVDLRLRVHLQLHEAVVVAREHLEVEARDLPMGRVRVRVRGWVRAWVRGGVRAWVMGLGFGLGEGLG